MKTEKPKTIYNNKEKFEEFKNKIITSGLRGKLTKACCFVFKSQIDLQKSNHEDIVKWFSNYLSSSVLLYQFLMINMAEKMVKKESGDDISEFMGDFNELFELMKDFKNLLEENSEQKPINNG